MAKRNTRKIMKTKNEKIIPIVIKSNIFIFYAPYKSLSRFVCGYDYYILYILLLLVLMLDTYFSSILWSKTLLNYENKA